MFFSKNNGPKVRDIVYLDEQACTAAAAKWLLEHPAGRIAVWFQQDLDRLRRPPAGIAEDRSLLAGRLSFSHEAGREILFLGHYPLRSVETALYEEQGISEALVYTHLDMPILVNFGSGRIKDMMLKMGMGQGEALEHPMITKAIQNALDKIAEKIVTDMPARSEAEWMQLYAPAIL